MELICPNRDCGVKLKAKPEQAGKRFRCPNCKMLVTVPGVDERGSGMRKPRSAIDTVAGNGGSTRDPAATRTETEDAVAEVWQPGDVILDLYEVKTVLGEGGYGTVFKVHHRGWNRELAVKSPKPGRFRSDRQKQKFIDECETWGNLGLHPHTVSCFYVRTLGGIPRVFAEYVEGGNLKEWIAQGKTNDIQTVLDIAIQISWGMAFAHEKGLVHRDLKPANVLMTPGGTAKVTDFGLARQGVAPSEDATGGPTTGPVQVSTGLGTRGYMAPEQASAGAEIDHRADIFAFGVTLWRMLGGRLPWVDKSSAIARHSVKAMLERNDPGSVPSEVSALILRCLEPEPEDRWNSFTAVSGQLKTVYLKLVKSDYQRLEPKAADILADGLNNRGVSLWDLGKTGEAEAAFGEALKLNTNHPRATFNLGLLRWRDCRSTDTQILTKLNEIRSSRDNDWETAYAIGLVHLERLDAEGAVEKLKEAQQLGGGLEVEAALEKARRIPSGGLRCLRTFEERGSLVMSVAFSPDGRSCLSGHMDATLRLWNASTGRCVRTFKGHSDSVYSVAFSPDGRFCLSGAWDHTLRLWDASTGRCVQTFEGHTGLVNSVAFSPDGHFCLSGSGQPLEDDDHTLRLWDASTGRCVRTFNGHSDDVRSVAFSPDGRFCLSGGSDVRLWDVSTGRCVRTFEGHTGMVNSMAFGPDGGFCLSGGTDATLRLWSASTGQCVRTFKGHTDDVTSVAFSPDGRFCLSGSRKDKTMRLWDGSTGRCVRTFEELAYDVESVAFSPDGRFCLSGSSLPVVGYKQLRLWDVSPCHGKRHRISGVLSVVSDSDQSARMDRAFSGLLEKTRQAHAAGDHAAALKHLQQARNMPDRGLVETVLDWKHSIGKQCIKTTFSNGWMKRSFEGHTQSVYSVAFSPDGRFCLSGSTPLGDKDNSLRLWNASTGRCVQTFEGHTDSVGSVAFSPDGRLCLSGGSPIRLWDVSKGQCVRTFGERFDSVTSVAFSPDGRFCLSGSHDKMLRLWDASTGQCLRTFEGHTDYVQSVAFSPDARFCLSGGWDNTLRLWDTSTGRCVRTLKGHSKFVYSVAFSPDGRFCLSGSVDKTLRLWDVLTGQSVRTFEGHAGLANSVAFSPDGGFCLSGGGESTLLLWDASTGQCLRTFEGHTDQVKSVALSLDGRFCLSGSKDKTLRLWELDWEYEFPGWENWDEGAKPYLEQFLTLHTPVGRDGSRHSGKPKWSNADFQRLIIDLQRRGYGWLREGGVRKKLTTMTANWQGPTLLP